MTCIICRRKIGLREPKSYANVRPATGHKTRKVCASAECRAAFDNWLDSLPVDNDGTPLEHENETR